MKTNNFIDRINGTWWLIIFIVIAISSKHFFQWYNGDTYTERQDVTCEYDSNFGSICY